MDIGDEHFTAAANGATAGLMRVFASGHGESVARGTIAGGQFVASNYAANIFTDRKYDEIRMVIQSGTVKDLAVEPPTVATLAEFTADTLARFKRPRRVEVVDVLPRTPATLQVQRRLLIERFSSR